MNKRLLERVKKEILAEPRKFNMGFFVRTSATREAERPPCGTVACIAGWGILLTALDKEIISEAKRVNEYKLAKICKQMKLDLDEELEFDLGLFGLNGAKVFGITQEQANALFFEEGWPRQFRRDATALESKQGGAERAAKRIDYFIETGE